VDTKPDFPETNMVKITLLKETQGLPNGTAIGTKISQTLRSNKKH
jgi:hypothetical protein